MVRVICLTGMPGCGKEEFVRVAQEQGLPIVRMGDVVREEAQRRGIKVSDETVGGMAHEDRVRHGFGIWAERTVPRIKDQTTAVDGIRGREELEVFRRAFGDDAVSWEEFLRRDERELGWGLAEVIATADHMIINDGDLEAFRARCRAVLDAVHP